MTNKKPEALIFADDRPSEIGDDLYQWASDSEDMIRRLHARIVELEAQLTAAQQADGAPITQDSKPLITNNLD